MKIFSFPILAVFLVACAGSPAWVSMRITSTEREAVINNEKIMKLGVGQSKQEVLKMMGAPVKREVYDLGNQRTIEFLFYRTSGWSPADRGDKDYQFTPFALENDALIGWGRNYYDNVVRAAVEIRYK